MSAVGRVLEATLPKSNDTMPCSGAGVWFQSQSGTEQCPHQEGGQPHRLTTGEGHSLPTPQPQGRGSARGAPSCQGEAQQRLGKGKGGRARRPVQGVVAFCGFEPGDEPDDLFPAYQRLMARAHVHFARWLFRLSPMRGTPPIALAVTAREAKACLKAIEAARTLDDSQLRNDSKRPRLSIPLDVVEAVHIFAENEQELRRASEYTSQNAASFEGIRIEIMLRPTSRAQENVNAGPGPDTTAASSGPDMLQAASDGALPFTLVDLSGMVSMSL